MNRSEPIVVIGAGLAGLSCAKELVRRQIPVVLLEAGDVVGGRVRTREIDGFRIDAGFQVLQTAYPEAQRQLDYARLNLRPFQPGALIRTQQRFVEMADPWRRPQALFSTLFNGVGTFADRLRLGRLRAATLRATDAGSATETDLPLDEFLRQDCGFSADFIDRFLRPWFSGVFLEPNLETSSQFFRFLFRMFAAGNVAVPVGGMQEIPKQLAESIPDEQIRLNSRVLSASANSVELDSGERLTARNVVLAVDGPNAVRLSGEPVCRETGYGTMCLQFAAPQAPVDRPILLLNGEGRQAGPVNNMCVISNVAPEYAPVGQSLISVSTCGLPSAEVGAVEAAARKQLGDWFGASVNQWSLVAADTIPFALPIQSPGDSSGRECFRKTTAGVYCCGDSFSSGSIHGAMLSGRLVAEHLSG